ncbi:TPA: (2Fe-2S)-binding protein [archaeon]|jgi:ferredoxin|uniref:(2Fe-2S)-binding protein n=1 Tax=Candidatus Undinarchaeum marinum TaxID=2756141 RepID=A0A832UZI0_9ARCH|nr:(2Fe-2S)-binding protein [Candidatus Undinarchaeum marinum]
MIEVHFLNDKKTVKAKEGDSIEALAREVDSSLPFGCRNGLCGTCLVTVEEGEENLSPIAPHESRTLATCGSKEKQRLACQCRIQKGMVKIKWG